MKHPIETLLGAFVIFVAVYFLVFASSLVRVRTSDGYKIQLKFTKVGNLAVGSDVRVSGIKIGSVSSLALDKNYMASVTVVINPTIKLPTDSEATVTSDGIMGNQYIRIEPGKAHAVLKPGDSIRKIKPFKSLEDTVGELIFIATGASMSPETEPQSAEGL